MTVAGHFHQTLLLLLTNKEHEVQERISRMWHTIIRPASELEVSYFTRLQRLIQSQIKTPNVYISYSHIIRDVTEPAAGCGFHVQNHQMHDAITITSYYSYCY